MPTSIELLKEWYSRVAKVAHTWPGHLLSTLCAPASNACSKDGRVEFIILYAFASQDNANKWHASEEKRSFMKEAERFVVSTRLLGGEAVDSSEAALWGASHNGWESVFIDAAAGSDKASPAARAVVPAKWKQCLMIYFAVSIAVIAMSLPGSLNEYVAEAIELKSYPWRISLQILITGIYTVPLIVFIVLPLLLKLFACFLHRPKPAPPNDSRPALLKFGYSTCC